MHYEIPKDIDINVLLHVLKEHRENGRQLKLTDSEADFLISLVKKSVPSSPTDEQLLDAGFRIGYCPSCRRFVSERGRRIFCPCGQRIKWETKENDG